MKKIFAYSNILEWGDRVDVIWFYLKKTNQKKQLGKPIKYSDKKLSIL